MASENCGEYLSIDETMLHEDLFTILSNKGGHGRKGTIIAMVRGTKTSEIVNVLMNLPEDKRAAVKEVTMDLSDSMYGAIQDAFPQATIVMDLFHVIKCCNSAVEILRMEAKRDAMKQRRDEYKKFKQKLARRRKNHKTKKRDRRGAPRKRINEQFHPTKLGNDETRVDLLTRSRWLLSTTPDKWSANTKKRAAELFKEYPKIEEAYNLVNTFRRIFRDKSISRETAKIRFELWVEQVDKANGLPDLQLAKDILLGRKEEILNYFPRQSTNASAESLNAKIKHFRAQVHGVSDMKFFMYRLMTIFG